MITVALLFFFNVNEQIFLRDLQRLEKLYLYFWSIRTQNSIVNIFADDRHAGRWGMREPLSQAGIIMISARDPPNAWLTVEKSGHWDIEVFLSCPRHFYRWPLVTHSLTQWVGDVLIPESAELSLRQSEWQYNNKTYKTLTNYYKVWGINFPNSELFKARVWQA